MRGRTDECVASLSTYQLVIDWLLAEEGHIVEELHYTVTFYSVTGKMKFSEPSYIQFSIPNLISKQ